MSGSEMTDQLTISTQLF